MDTTIVAQCKHGEGCTRTICQVLAGIEQDRAAGTYQEARLHTVSDATFPGHMRRRHNLQRGKAA